MAIAYDAFSAATPGTGNLSWTHTPTGTPRGVCVLIAYPVGVTDEITSITYGGVSMSLAANGYFAGTTGLEDGSVCIWRLSSGIPTGAQTVDVTVSGSSTKAAVCVTMTGNYDCIEVTDGGNTCTTFDAGTTSTPVCSSQSVHFQRGECLVLGVLLSGEDAVTSIASDVGYTDITEHDFGTTTANWNRKTTNYPAGGGSTGNLAAWTQSSDEAHAICIMMTEDIFLPGINQISETDTAQALSRLKNKALGQSSEVYTSISMSIHKQKMLGQNTETDTVTAVSRRHTKALGQNTETDTSQAMTASLSGGNSFWFSSRFFLEC